MKIKDINTSPLGVAFTKTNCHKLYSTVFNPDENDKT